MINLKSLEVVGWRRGIYLGDGDGESRFLDVLSDATISS